MKRHLQAIGTAATSILLALSMAVVPAIAVKAEDITLRLPSWWFGEPGNEIWMNQVVQDFMDANPGIKVDGYNLPYGSYADQMLMEMSSGTPPDVIHLTNLNIGDYLRNDLLLPLDEFMAESDISAETFTPAQFASPIVTDGQTYGVIHMVANYIPFYNADLLAEAGFEEFPDNPADFLAMAQALSNPPESFGYAAMVKPGSYVETYMDVAQWVIAGGGSFAVDGKPTINAPANIAAIEQFKSLFDAGVMPRDVDKSTYRQMWWQGKVAVLFDGSWMMGFARAENPDITPKLRTALMPWPGHLTASAFQIWSVPRGAPNPEAAFKLIEFMQSPEQQVKMVSITNTVSPRFGSLPEGYLDENPWFHSFQEASDKYAVSIMPEGLEAYGNEILKIIADKIELILYRDADIEASLNEAQSEVEALISG
ncbi:MAG: extracellular solute-binding protein [Rhodobacteraceae bacterium]|nr:extracellular solute-binding protein [Paracoccaceae bacterium]